MANAAVLKTADRKVLQVRILCPPLVSTPRRWFVLTAVAVLLAAGAATPRAACACSTKLGAFRTAAASNVRDFGTAQAALRADSGRFGTVEELTALGLFSLQAGVVVVEEAVTRDRWSLRLAHQEAPELACWSAEEAGRPPPPPDPSTGSSVACARFPVPPGHIAAGVLYFGVLLVALGIRVAVAVSDGTRPPLGRLAALIVLLVVHPFWNLRPSAFGARLDACGNDIDVVSLVLAAAAAYWALRWPPSSAPPP